jgi:hypothetical protein
MRHGQEATYFPGLRPQKVAGAKRFGVRQLAAVFPRRKLASGSASSKLETRKRQQAAALQTLPKRAVRPKIDNVFSM